MGRNGGLFGRLRGIDAFGKTMDDVRIRTNVGAIITLVSAFLIVFLTIGEFMDYRRVHTKNSLVVDVSRGEKLTVHLDITFPRVPCYLLSLDIMDISGEHQNDIQHDIIRTRLSHSGLPVEEGKRGLRGEANDIAAVKGKVGYCGECYGGQPPESGCCNTCDEVRESYVRRGWSFSKPDGIEQCVAEHWSEKIKEQNKEGCNVAGLVHVNKVVGNFHLSPGRAFQANSVHIHDLVPYLAGTGAEHHDFGHIINKFGFGSEEEFHMSKDKQRPEDNGIKKKLGVVDPLNGVHAHTEKSQFMFQYFVKVVGTEYQKLDGQMLKTHQYSVTQYERDLDPGANANAAAEQGRKMGSGHQKAPEPHQTQHGFVGVPGVFFNYEISALKTVHTESRQTLAHFLTNTCAIVGGILTVAGLLDGIIYNGRMHLGGGKTDYAGASDGLGYASANGKFM
ncbi:DUF1692-domain-containing protein [Tilletiaria anomala UBC 951]|uniref:DUF1692-domain-containing protein n=1 Tax=Tilletiaria anomala (strain ATCC 24038 / CBS 436.72 / UBC 951) TaxID=1037660 RepID=A0A066WGT7_TILAU|nr:DUF1692-domain-containing protein [Tilletiaria anomala UBC 951]KDN53212.1 DUF1692-domain-containing protein [Tilletiaria anomala UBC 951]